MRANFGRKQNPEHDEPQVWLVYLGATSAENSGLVLAAVTGTEAEAWSMLTQARRRMSDRPNLIEERPFATTASAAEESGSPELPARSALGVGERRTVFVLVTGSHDATEGHGVFESAEDGIEPRDHLVARGFDDARLCEVITNTWLLDLP